ncbi:MAG: hypothetical protein TRG1_3373 [Flavobacteriaceae bacterium FS1-H7996/R]|nr:MAG: hypothetical protein TRG1_3373 [Flavobacteriaceae bacterium FS1-H7996/R]
MGVAGRFFQYALPEHPAKLFYERRDLRGRNKCALWMKK